VSGASWQPAQWELALKLPQLVHSFSLLGWPTGVLTSERSLDLLVGGLVLERLGESLVEILDLARSLVMVDIVVCDGDVVTGLSIWLQVGKRLCNREHNLRMVRVNQNIPYWRRWLKDSHVVCIGEKGG
jgi:hypothetical protein